MKTELYCFVNELYEINDRCQVVTATKNGKIIKSCNAYNIEDAKRMIGYTSILNRSFYDEKYPNGYILNWLDDNEAKTFLMKAKKQNKISKFVKEKIVEGLDYSTKQFIKGLFFTIIALCFMMTPFLFGGILLYLKVLSWVFGGGTFLFVVLFLFFKAYQYFEDLL